MLIIEVKERESIDAALKRYKKKRRDVQLLKDLRRRKHFTKPSVERRGEIMNAKYRNEKYADK